MRDGNPRADDGEPKRKHENTKQEEQEMATNSEGKICAEISRICGSENAYFGCEVDPATNAVVWRLDLYGKARGYQRLAFATEAEAEAFAKQEGGEE